MTVIKIRRLYKGAESAKQKGRGRKLPRPFLPCRRAPSASAVSRRFVLPDRLGRFCI